MADETSPKTPVITCRGRLLPRAQQAIKRAFEEENTQKARMLDLINRGILNDIHVREEVTYKAKRVHPDTNEIYEEEVMFPLGPGCGASLDEVIAQESMPGEYVGTCPKCGVNFHFSKVAMDV